MIDKSVRGRGNDRDERGEERRKRNRRYLDEQMAVESRT
jgi:hypothetical protein